MDTVTVDVMSDVQGNLGELKKALNAQASLGLADILVVNGDLVKSGRLEEYNALFAALEQNPHPEEMAFTLGNHELYANESSEMLISRFLQYSKMPAVYSSRLVKGLPLVFLGTLAKEDSRHSVYLGEAQLDWLEQTLATYARQPGPVLVFSHHPLSRTVSGTVGRDASEIYSRDYAEDTRLLQILGDHPNVVFFSGHTHWDLRRDDWATRKVVPGGDSAGFTAVNTGAIGQLYGPDGNGGEAVLTNGSVQALRLRVNREQVIVEARDYRSDEVIRTLAIAITPLEARAHPGERER